MSRILILGGTAEAAQLAQDLHDQGHEITTSLAGRTHEPAPLPGNIRIGGFGGPQGLADWLTTNEIDLLIDATHPFAGKISANARAAADIAAIPIEVRQRPPWVRQAEDHWIEVENLSAAVQVLEAGSTAFLALGSQHIAQFAQRTDVRFIVRMVDPPTEPLPLSHHHIILGKPSMDWKEEASLFKQTDVSVIVSRNSGGTGAYAKIEAARHLSLPVVMIGRPQ